MSDVNAPADTADSGAITLADIFGSRALAAGDPDSCPQHGAIIAAELRRRGKVRKLVFACECVWNIDERSLRSHDER